MTTYPINRNLHKFKIQGPEDVSLHSENTESLFQEELPVKKWCVNSRHWCSHKHTADNPAGSFSVFFGLCSGGAGTIEFQYHNCLFLCVSLK